MTLFYKFKAFQQKDNLIAATLNLLTVLRVKVTATAVKETLLGNPDYPSLYAVSTSLKKWKIDSAAYHIKPEQLSLLPVPFIAHLKTDSGSFITVTEVDLENITYLKDNGTESRKSFHEFYNQWSNNVLLVETNEDSGQIDYAAHKKSELLSFLKLPALIVLFVITGVISYIQSAQQYTGSGSVLYASMYITSLAGLFITSLLLWYDFDHNNNYLKKICGISKQTDCNAVLGSSASKFLGVSWSEIGFFYFIGSYIYLCTSGSDNRTIFPLIILNLIALPYILFSVSYQAFVIKQWCVLCLAVQAVLLTGFIVILTTHSLSTDLFEHPGLITSNMFFAFFLPAAVWLIIKPYLHDKKQDQETKFEYQRFKNNPEIFGSLLNGQEAVKNSLAGLGILLGNADAPNTLTKICNPYCGPCAQSFPHLQELLKNHGDQWNVQIIFMATPDERDERALPVAHFFAIQESDNADQVINIALADWYNAKTKDYNAYKIKYPILVNFDRLKHKLEEMSNWCNLENIQFTPTYYVNGRRLPESYSISDLGNIF